MVSAGKASGFAEKGGPCRAFHQEVRGVGADPGVRPSV